jgi:3-oxoadipate enol-lactonase
MPVAPVNGIELYYEIEGDGDWVVFAHGGEGCHLHWWQQVAALRGRYRCLTFDARGFGLSGGRWGNPEDTAAPDLKGLLDHLQIDRAFLVGQSMGGMAVSGVALAHPERVRGLVMGDTPFGIATAALSKWAADTMAKMATFNVFEHLTAPDFATARPDLHYLYHAIARLNATRPLPADTTDYEAGYVRMRDRPPGDYSKFRVPTLCIVGEHDALTPRWVMQATADALKAQLVIIPGAGHSAFFERSDAYNRALSSFFAQVESTPG